MTALSEYARLETTGLWRETPDSQRREVVVSLGDATLVISTMTDSALSHWSLPAVHRLNPGKRPALYAPDAEADELLEISEPQMIEAIETLRRAIDRTRPKPGRLRWLGMLMSFAGADLCCNRNYTILPGYKVKSALDAGALSAGCAAVGASGEVAFTLYSTRIPRPRLQDAT